MGDQRLETVGEALRGVFADPKWLRKCVIGALVTLIPYAGAIWVMGYGLTYQRNLAWRRSEMLPEWRNAGEQMKTGLYGFVVALVYSFPLTLLITLGMGAAILVPAAASGGSTPDARFWIIFSMALLVMMGLLVGLSALLMPVYVQVALYDRIEAGFRAREIIARARVNSATFWTLFRRSLALMALSMVLSMGVLAVIVGGSALVSILLLRALAPSEWSPVLMILLVSGAEFVAFALMAVMALPIGLANYRLWAGYGRVAYRLGEAEAAPLAEM